MIRALLAAAVAGCAIVGTIGVALAESGRIGYTGAPYAIAENLLVIAACLTLALVLWRPATLDAPTPTIAVPMPADRPGRTLTGLIVIALMFTAALRAIAPASLFLTIGLMPIALFVLPGLTWIEGWFRDLPLLWRVMLTPALSLALMLIVIAWIIWLRIPLTPFAVITAAALLSLSGRLAPLVISRLAMRPRPAPPPESAV